MYVSYTLENLMSLLIMYNGEPLWDMAKVLECFVFHKQEEEAFLGRNACKCIPLSKNLFG